MHIHPHRLVPRNMKEDILGQKAHVFWFYGLSGSGKSTLTVALEKQLTAEGRLVTVLDGDNLRSGLNAELGFSDAARRENIRRVSEVSKLFLDAGVIVLASFITPKREFRNLVRRIIGDVDVTLIYTEASFAICAERDVKGLYAKAKRGEIRQFTGSDSDFEPPVSTDTDWVLPTDQMNEESALAQLRIKMDAIIKPV